MISFEDASDVNDENVPMNYDHLNSEIPEGPALRQSEPLLKQLGMTLSKQVNNIRKARKTAVNINTSSLPKIHLSVQPSADNSE